MSSVYSKRTAQEIIKYYGITKPDEIEIEAIALDRKVFVNDIFIKGSVARLQVKRQHGIISVNTNIKEPGKRRFAIAHELGHFELHKEKSKSNICSDKDFLNWYREKIDENEANAFAAELLMPESIFREYCPRDLPSFTLIGNLAEIFKTSLTATAFRYVELGHFPCALIASVDGRIKWMSCSSDFPSRILQIDTPVHKLSVAGSCLLGESAPSLPELVEKSYWLESGNENEDLKLHEHAVNLTTYNTILSLLFFN